MVVLLCEDMIDLLQGTWRYVLRTVHKMEIQNEIQVAYQEFYVQKFWGDNMLAWTPSRWLRIKMKKTNKFIGIYCVWSSLGISIITTPHQIMLAPSILQRTCQARAWWMIHAYHTITKDFVWDHGYKSQCTVNCGVINIDAFASRHSTVLTPISRRGRWYHIVGESRFLFKQTSLSTR